MKKARIAEASASSAQASDWRPENSVDPGQRLRVVFNAAAFSALGASIMASVVANFPVGVVQQVTSPGEALSVALRSSWGVYCASLESSPVLTKACTSGVVYWLGDVIAQAYESKASFLRADPVQSLRCGVVGLFLHGPLSHLWFLGVDKLFGPAMDSIRIVGKIALDQTVWSLVWNSLFYLSVSCLRMEPLARTLRDLPRTSFDLMKAGWRLWVPAHLLTYGLVPTNFRLAWVDVVEVGWVLILSVYKSRRTALSHSAAA